MLRGNLVALATKDLERNMDLETPLQTRKEDRNLLYSSADGIGTRGHTWKRQSTQRAAAAAR